VVIRHLITPNSPASCNCTDGLSRVPKSHRNSTTYPGTWNEAAKSFKNQPSLVQHDPVQDTSSNDTANQYCTPPTVLMKNPGIITDAGM
jgi:hypothetical protein